MTWLHWALLSAFFAGLTAVLAKAGVKDVDSNLATAIRTVVVVALAWLIVAWQGTAAGLMKVPPLAWLFLVLSGLATGASWLCYFRALQLGDAARVAPLDKLSVVVVIVLAAVFLGEAVTWRHALAAALMVGAAFLLAT
jgi:transporter family protein